MFLSLIMLIKCAQSQFMGGLGDIKRATSWIFFCMLVYQQVFIFIEVI